MSARTRLNFLDDEPWDEVNEGRGIRARRLGLTLGTDALGASLLELLPGSPGAWLHMHYGCEEMFFVLGGRPTLRTPEGEEELAPGEVVYCPEGVAGLHTFANRTDEPVRMLGVSAGRYPDVVAYPEQGVAWAATRVPELPAPPDDPGIIARFELPEPRA